MKWLIQNLATVVIVLFVLYIIFLAICYACAGEDEWKDPYK